MDVRPPPMKKPPGSNYSPGEPHLLMAQNMTYGIIALGAMHETQP